MVFGSYSLPFWGFFNIKRSPMSVPDWQRDLDRLYAEAYRSTDGSLEPESPVPKGIFLRMQGEQLSFEKPLESHNWGFTWDQLKRKFLRRFTSQYDLRQSLQAFTHLIVTARAGNASSTSNKAKVDDKITALSHVLDHLRELEARKRGNEQPPSDRPQEASQPAAPEPRPTRPVYGGIVEQKSPEPPPSPTAPQRDIKPDRKQSVAEVFWRGVFHKRTEELNALRQKAMVIWAEADTFKKRSGQDSFPAFNTPEMNELIQGISDLTGKCLSPTCTTFDERIEFLKTLCQNLETKYDLWQRRLALYTRCDKLKERADKLKPQPSEGQGLPSKMERFAAVASRAKALSETEMSLERVKTLEADVDTLEALLEKREATNKAADAYVQAVAELQERSALLQTKLKVIEGSPEYQRIQIWAKMADRLPEEAKSQILTCLQMHELATQMVEAVGSEQDLGIVEKRISEIQEKISSLTPMLKELEGKYVQYSQCALDEYKALCLLKKQEDFDIERLSAGINRAKRQELLSTEELTELVKETQALEQKKEALQKRDGENSLSKEVVSYLRAVNTLQESNNILLKFFPENFGSSFLKTAYTEASEKLLSQLSGKPEATNISDLLEETKKFNEGKVKGFLTERVWQEWHANHYIRKPTMTRDQFLQLDARTQGNYLWEIQSGNRAAHRHTP